MADDANADADFCMDSDSDGAAPVPSRSPKLSFHEFGIEFVVSGQIVAVIEYESLDPEMPKEVSLSMDNFHPKDTRPQLRVAQHWFKYATDWPEKRKALFRGEVAKALAPMVEAALEVARPSYTRSVLKEYFNMALSNPNPSPHYGGTTCVDFSGWYTREAEISKMLASMDARVAAACTDELAKMYTNRRLGNSIVERGPMWASHLPYVSAARKPEGGDLDLPRALLTLYVYVVQLDAWEVGHIVGDKAAMRQQVCGLEREFKAQFAKEFGFELMQHS